MSEPPVPPTAAPACRCPAPDTILALVVAAGLAAAAAAAVVRAFRLRPDWLHWAEELEILFRTGAVADGTAMYGYPPGAFFLLAPFAAWTPPWVGVPAYVLSQIAAYAVAVWAVRRWWLGAPPAGGTGRASTLGLSLLLTAVALFEPITANQMSAWVLALCALGVAGVRNGRGFGGGFALGAAALLKPPVGLLTLFCLWKRRWSALGGAAAAGLVLDVLPCLIFFGWFAPAGSAGHDDAGPVSRAVAGTVREHLRWLDRVGEHGAYWYVEQPVYYRRNHGAPSVLARWLRGIPDTDHLLIVADADIRRDGRTLTVSPRAEADARAAADLLPGSVTIWYAPEPAKHRKATGITRLDLRDYPRWNVAALSADAVRWIHMLYAAAIAAALLWITRPRADDDQTWYVQAALCMVAICWLAPYVTHNHFVWAFPAVALLCALFGENAGLTTRRERAVVGAGLGLWAIGQLIRPLSPMLLFYGAYLAATFGLGVGLIVLLRAARRRAQTPPAPAGPPTEPQPAPAAGGS